MNSVAIIPARMESSRFPNKPMKKILGMPMIGHCYQRTQLSQRLQATYVATCNEEIFDYIESIGEGCNDLFSAYQSNFAYCRGY